MGGGKPWGRHSGLLSARGGLVVVSIDLELDREHYDLQRQRRLDEVRARLIDVTRACAMPATWAVADPMLSAATESILNADCGHEIAVLGDQAWLGKGCGRSRLGRELKRRFSVPRAAGIPVSTLAVRNVPHVFELDLLIEHGVTAVCEPGMASAPAHRETRLPPIRFGLWQPPTAWKMPLRAPWWSPAGWSIRREVKRAIRYGTMLHLRLDAVRLVDSRGFALEAVAGLLRHLSSRRDSGQLAIETIGRLAAAALECRAGSPSRSALLTAA